jgi:putative Mn2+ efflux pump MntP
MDNETLFFISGIVLAVSAVVVSFLGLRVEKFPGKAAPIIAVWFIALIGSVTTFAVLHAEDEKEHKEHALSEASHEAEEEEAEAPEAGH